ncbi:MAG: S41 family peptidase [Armatimonas sp.]
MTDWEKDFSYFWESIRDNHAYLSEAPCSWAAVPRAYAAELAAVKDKIGFIRLLERAIGELCDNHASLGTNLGDSYRLVPSGTDIRVEARPNGISITDLRSPRSDLKPGDRVLKMEAALASVWPKTVPQNNLAAATYCANLLIAGQHDRPRQLVTQQGPITLEGIEHGSAPKELVRFETRRSIGWIRPQDSLGDNKLITEFDSAMTALQNTKGLILDLTDTPSGGNTTVARAILSWFVSKEQPYQRHEDPSEFQRFGVRRFWTEWVAPRPGKQYRGPLYVLVNGWTGSMGEGIAIALQGMKRAKLLGMPMAGLKGAVSRDEMPLTKIPFYFPTERLFRVDGTPREKCLPDIPAPTITLRQRAEALLEKR